MKLSNQEHFNSLLRNQVKGNHWDYRLKLTSLTLKCWINQCFSLLNAYYLIAFLIIIFNLFLKYI
jgi:hypothetical protein